MWNISNLVGYRFLQCFDICDRCHILIKTCIEGFWKFSLTVCINDFWSFQLCIFVIKKFFGVTSLIKKCKVDIFHILSHIWTMIRIYFITYPFFWLFETAQFSFAYFCDHCIALDIFNQSGWTIYIVSAPLNVSISIYQSG